MEARKYADALSIHPTFSLVRENREKYDVEAKRTREEKTDALRAENAKLAAERDARERAKDLEHEEMHGPRVRFEMVDGLRPQDVDRAIFRGRRAGDIGHRTVAFYLADCADRGLYQELGHSSVDHVRGEAPRPLAALGAESHRRRARAARAAEDR